MRYRKGIILAGLIMMILSVNRLSAQISPGDLSNPHSKLEGISNCTQCHVLGNKQTNEKCLACHTEINERISSRKGYHSSSEVKGKQCFTCHSEHNGKNFELIRIDIEKFDHNLLVIHYLCHMPKKSVKIVILQNISEIRSLKPEKIPFWV